MGTLFYGVHPTKRINKGTRPTSSIPNFDGVKEINNDRVEVDARNANVQSQKDEIEAAKKIQIAFEEHIQWFTKEPF